MNLFLDLDGVIIDFWPRYYQIHKDLCGVAGVIPFPLKRYKELKQGRVGECTIFKLLGADNPENMEKIRYKMIEDWHYLKMDYVDQKIKENLNSLRMRKFLVTMRKNRKNLDKQLEINEIHLDGVFNDQDKSEVMSKFSGPGIMIGDCPEDIKAADSVGIASVGVLSGMGTRDTLNKAGTCTIIDHFWEFSGGMLR